MQFTVFVQFSEYPALTAVGINGGSFLGRRSFRRTLTARTVSRAVTFHIAQCMTALSYHAVISHHPNRIAAIEKRYTAVSQQVTLTEILFRIQQMRRDCQHRSAQLFGLFRVIEPLAVSGSLRE